MSRRNSLIVGVTSFLLPLLLLAISILLSPWFRWEANALSDLGHATGSRAAWIYNLGLVTGGILLIIYSLNYSSRNFPITSKVMVLTGYSLVLVGTFDEVYRGLHYIVSVLFFLLLAIAALSYSYESKKNYPIAIVIVSVVAWILQLTAICPCGEAVPEIISVLLTLVWYFDIVLKVYRTGKWS